MDKEVYRMKQLLENWKRFLNEDVSVKVLGYIKPDSAFHTLKEWEGFVRLMLDKQKEGNSVRGGEITGSEEFASLIYEFFGFQLNTELDRYALLGLEKGIRKLFDRHRHTSLCLFLFSWRFGAIRSY